jgi:hypothetical protein
MLPPVGANYATNTGHYNVSFNLEPYIMKEDIIDKELNASSIMYDNYTIYSFTIQPFENNQMAAVTIYAYDKKQLVSDLRMESDVKGNLMGYRVEKKSISTVECQIDNQKGYMGTGSDFSGKSWHGAVYWVDNMTYCIIISNYDKIIFNKLLKTINVRYVFNSHLSRR